ncbi:MAG: PAS domain-containing sensor histidine kinase [Candidatus Kapaibacterium sp.]
MDLSIRTIIAIIFITSIIQFIVLYYQYKINKKYDGIGWWLLWSGAELGIFFIMFSRSYTPFADYFLLLQNFLVLLSMIFLYAGIIRFIGKEIDKKLIFIFSVVFLLIHFYATIIIDYAPYRTTTNNLLIGLVTSLIAYNLYRYRPNTIKTSANFTATALLIHSIVFYVVSFLNFYYKDNINPFNATTLNFLQYSNILISGILWTFGVILMLNQKLSSELRDSTEDFKLLFNLSPDNVLITKMEDRVIVDANTGFTKIMGFSREEALGKSADDLIIWKDIKDRNEFIKLIKDKGDFENIEVRFINKYGKQITGLLSGRVINFQGEPHILSVSRDITERKIKEEIIRESEEKYRLLTENMKDVIWIMDAETQKFTYVSPSVKRLREYTPEEIINAPLSIALSSEWEILFKTTIRNHVEKLKTGTESYDKYFTNELMQPSKDESMVWTEVISTFHNNDKTGRIEIQGVTRDITDRKKAEMEIQKKNKELQKLNFEKDKFFSIISHDLRSPFNGILGLSNLLATDIEQLSKEEIQEISLNLNKSANNYFRLLTNLLEWAKMQGRLTEYNPEKLRLNNFISETINLFTETANSKDIKLEFEVADDIEITTDRFMLDTILRNLVSNSLKFTNKGGNISITANKSDNKTEIRIKDSGIGMSQDIIDNLFKIDKQSNRMGTDNEPGTGLGLILCKEFIDKHNGELHVKSEEGKGSEFTIVLNN